MTDLPPPDSREDAILLDAFDGDADAAAMVASTPHLASALDEMRANRDALLAAPARVDGSVREQSISAALSVFDDLQASKVAAGTVATVTGRRRRSQHLLRALGLAAVSAAAVVGVVTIGPGLDNSGDSTTAIGAAATTAATQAGIAEDDTDEALTSRATTAAAAEAEAAPAATIAAATPATTAVRPTADATLGTTTAPSAGDSAEFLGIDPVVVTCALSQDRDITSWVTVERMDPESSGPGSGSIATFIVVTDAGIELEVELNLETCEFIAETTLTTGQ